MSQQNLLDQLNKIVESRPSFQTIMADGVVSDAEIEEQAKLVNELIGKVEKTLSPADFSLVSELIAELSVLQLVTRLNHKF